MFFETIEAEMLDDACDILADYAGTGEGNTAVMTAMKEDYGLTIDEANSVLNRAYAKAR